MIIRSSKLIGRGSTRRRRRGAEILEAALVMPLLLSLSGGMLEFGYYYFVMHTIQSAAREGARARCVHLGTDADGKAAADTIMLNANAGFAGKYTTTLVPTTVNGDIACTKVTVSATWGTIGFSPMGLINKTKNITGTATMRIEQ